MWPKAWAARARTTGEPACNWAASARSTSGVAAPRSPNRSIARSRADSSPARRSFNQPATSSLSALATAANCQDRNRNNRQPFGHGRLPFCRRLELDSQRPIISAQAAVRTRRAASTNRRHVWQEGLLRATRQCKRSPRGCDKFSILLSALWPGRRSIGVQKHTRFLATGGGRCGHL